MNQLALVADERHVEARSLRLKNVVSSTEVSHECLESAWIQSASLVYMDLRAMGIDMGLTLTNTLFPAFLFGCNANFVILQVVRMT